MQASSGDYLMSAMTAGIRNSWIQAIKKCMEDNNINNSPIPPKESRPPYTDLLHAHGATNDVSDYGAKQKTSKLPLYSPQNHQVNDKLSQFTDTAPTERTFALSRIPKTPGKSSPQHTRSSSTNSVEDEVIRYRTVDVKSKPVNHERSSSYDMLDQTENNIQSGSRSRNTPDLYHQHKGPSVKLRERSRSKSPRARSPPLKVRGSSYEDSFDTIVRRNTITLPASFNVEDLVETNWKQVGN